MTSLGRAAVVAALLALTLRTARAHADEGMWLFTNVPKEQLKKKYGFDVTQKWLDHLRKSCVRFPGGSGSFLSPQGLVMTNHHVGSGAIQRLSTPKRDLLTNGFHARSFDEELKCDGLELNVL